MELDRFSVQLKIQDGTECGQTCDNFSISCLNWQNKIFYDAECPKKKNIAGDVANLENFYIQSNVLNLIDPVLPHFTPFDPVGPPLTPFEPV